MLAGGLQGYMQVKNEREIRAEQRAARLEQLELQKKTIQMQQDQNAWMQNFQTTQQGYTEGNTDADRLLKQRELDNQGRLIDAQIKAIGGRPSGGTGRPRGPGGPGGGGGEFGGYSSYAELLAAEQKYSSDIAKSLAGREDFAVQYDRLMADWRMNRGLGGGGQEQPQGQPAAPTIPQTGNPTVDAINAKREQDARNASRMKRAAGLSRQGGLMLAEELKRGSVPQSTVESAALDPSSLYFLEANDALGLQAKEQIQAPYRAAQRRVIPGGYGMVP